MRPSLRSLVWSSISIMRSDRDKKENHQKMCENMLKQEVVQEIKAEGIFFS